MNFSEVWKVMHGKCKDSASFVDGEYVIFNCPEHKITVSQRIPYPSCHTPLKCAGEGTCRQEIACND